MTKQPNQILDGYGTTIFTVMSALATEHDAINLGQGFPDDQGPDDIRNYAARALDDFSNQYPPMEGIPELRQAVASHNRHFYGLELDWRREILVTSGATEALAASMFGLVNPGDEVVLFEPFYDCYMPILELAGARVKLIRLEPPGWTIPQAELEAAITPDTKLLVINSPLNPVGKVFTREELSFIAELLARNNVWAVCDDVYEHLTFDGRRHLPLMTFPGMRERTVRVESAGKTFSLTGWKVGYVIGAPDLLTPIMKAHQFLTFTTPPNLQHAVAYGLSKPDVYYRNLRTDLQSKRDFLADGLSALGFEVLPSAGTYFLTADFRPLGFNGTDEEFCRKITVEAGVAAVPLSAFYHQDGPRHLVRFCFCKQETLLAEAIDRLRRFFGKNAW